MGSERRREETETETPKREKILKKESWFRRKVEIDNFPLTLLFFQAAITGHLIFNSNANLLNKALVVITLLSTFILTVLWSDFLMNLESGALK